VFAGLVGITLWRDIAFLAASPYPYGIDGYYYLALAEGDGWTLSGRSVPVLPTIALRVFAFLLSPTIGIKALGLICLYATGAMAFHIVRRSSRNTALGMLGFFLVVKGFLRAELLVNFPKQSMGHLCVLIIAYCLVVWRPSREWQRWVCIAVLLAVSGLTHSVALGLSLLLVASWLIIHVFSRVMSRRYHAVCFVGSIALVWIAVFAASQLYRISERWGAMLYLSTSPRPRFTVPFLYDGLSPITMYFPATFYETSLLCAAVLGLAFLSWRLGRSRRHTRIDRLWRQAIVFLPQAALVCCPFLVPAHLDRVGLHFRLLGSLGLVSAVMVPLLLYVYFPRRKTWVAAGLVTLLALPPHAWSPSVSPPMDDGALHRAMVARADRIPDNAVVITSQAIGNMVTALWHRPRVVATRFDLPLSGANYYRLSIFPGDLAPRLEAFGKTENGPVMVHPLVGPWVLVKEETYRAFREHLRVSEPELAAKLVE
jgi:hypothetical protein